MPTPVAMAAAIVVEAIARRSRTRGGAVHAGRYHGRGYAVAGRGYGYHPVARTAVRRGVYRGAAYGAAAGAAAAGAYGYYNGGYNNGCYQNSYGAWVCPRQYPY